MLKQKHDRLPTSANQNVSDEVFDGLMMFMENIEQRANGSLVQLAMQGELTRRDATGVADLVFDSAHQALEEGLDVASFKTIGENLQAHLQDPVRLDENTRGFMAELEIYSNSDNEDLYTPAEKAAIDRAHELLSTDNSTAFRYTIATLRNEIIPDDSTKLVIFGKYAVARANLRQRHIEKEFGNEFQEAKGIVATSLEVTLRSYGVTEEDIVRSLAQLESAVLVAPDELIQPVTGAEGRSVFADQRLLKVQPYFSGEQGSPVKPEAAESVLTFSHELFHVASRQPVMIEERENLTKKITPLRTGIEDAAGQLIELNEGLTELLAREATGHALDDETLPQTEQVLRVAALREEQPTLFSVLISSAYGANLHPDFPEAVRFFLNSTKRLATSS